MSIIFQREDSSEYVWIRQFFPLNFTVVPKFVVLFVVLSASQVQLPSQRVNSDPINCFQLKHNASHGFDYNSFQKTN